MGDIGADEANGVVMEDRLVSTNPDPSTISEDYWAVAEQTTQEVVNSIHPTLDFEEKRKDVIDYVQRLIRCSLGFQVRFPFFSSLFLHVGFSQDFISFPVASFGDSWSCFVSSYLSYVGPFLLLHSLVVLFPFKAN